MMFIATKWRKVVTVSNRWSQNQWTGMASGTGINETGSIAGPHFREFVLRIFSGMICIRCSWWFPQKVKPETRLSSIFPDFFIFLLFWLVSQVFLKKWAKDRFRGFERSRGKGKRAKERFQGVKGSRGLGERIKTKGARWRAKGSRKRVKVKNRIQGVKGKR